MKNPAMRPELSLLSRFQGGTHIRPHGLGLTLPLCVGRYRQIIWRCRLAASRFSQFAACSGAPRRIADPKAQDYADFQSAITAGICDRRNGLQYKFA